MINFIKICMIAFVLLKSTDCCNAMRRNPLQITIVPAKPPRMATPQQKEEIRRARIKRKLDQDLAKLATTNALIPQRGHCKIWKPTSSKKNIISPRASLSKIPPIFENRDEPYIEEEEEVFDSPRNYENSNSSSNCDDIVCEPYIEEEEEVSDSPRNYENSNSSINCSDICAESYEEEDVREDSINYDNNQSASSNYDEDSLRLLFSSATNTSDDDSLTKTIRGTNSSSDDSDVF